MPETATRLQCISNYKLRFESSRNDPRLRNLLGHIAIYDSVREYRRAQIKQTPCPYPTEFYPQLKTPPLPPPQTQSRKTRPRLELQGYLDLQESGIPSFQDFQAAIEMQIATLSEIQSTSRKLQALSQSCPSIDESDEKATEVEVEEYCDDSDSDTVSEYDSYDGDGDWRDDEDSESEDSMTDPESVRSECSSPIEDKNEDGEDYFDLVPLTPLIKAGLEV